MAEWTRSASVGIFALVLAGAGVGIYSFISKRNVGKTSIEVHTTFRDAIGLATFSRVNMAGIPVGSIKRITLTPEGKARIDIELKEGVVLHKDATVAKQTATLLSEPFLSLTPGTPQSPVMVNGDQIVNVLEPITTDQILQDVGHITNRMKNVADSLSNSIGSQKGEDELKQILRNVEQATAALNSIAQENRLTLRRTFQNIETITNDAKPKTATILNNVSSTTKTLDKIVKENRDDIRGITHNARTTLEKADKAGNSLESALVHVDSIAARIDRGEGTVGRLTKDDALINEIEGAAEGVNDLVGGISRLQTVVGLRSDYNFLSNTIKNYVEIRLQPREDKYYSIELVNDPRGLTKFEQIDVNTTNPNQPPHYREVRTTTTNSLRFSLQFARRLGPFTGRFGIKESTGGIGIDTHLFDNRFELLQDLFGFGEQLTPRWRTAFMYEFIKRLWLLGGIDNILVAERRDYFVGLHLRFNDQDLKSILLFVPSGSM
jgi:phospholipid/cholesterol/gamma-HCH transport system substrate-binding protein